MNLLNEKLRQLSSLGGRRAFRGQANVKWKLHAPATRRLIQHNKKYENIVHTPEFSSIYITYHNEVLIKPVRKYGFDSVQGERISDLQLLAKLQHLGAATGLLDFTWDPLVALWFACEESIADNTQAFPRRRKWGRETPACDGKVFIVTLDDPIKFQPVGIDEEQQSVSAIFSPEEGILTKTRYWEPMIQGEAAHRILRQRSVFVIGCPVVPENIVFDELVVKASEKKELRELLKNHFDVNEQTLFIDIHGFCKANAASAGISVPVNPNDYLREANRFAQQGNWLNAIEHYDRYIASCPDIGETYFLRGNAHAQLGEYHKALHDYDKAIEYADKPPYFRVLLWMVHFNRGNISAALGKPQKATEDYTEAIQAMMPNKYEAFFFNRANALTMLNNLEGAITDYDEAISLGYKNAHFNKGNALVRLGKFDDALQCYEAFLQENGSNEDARQNQQAVQEILEWISGTTPDFVDIGYVQGQKAFEVSVPAARTTEPTRLVFCGNIGNQGNVGASTPGVAGRIDGGKGFPGKHGFLVFLTSHQS